MSNYSSVIHSAVDVNSSSDRISPDKHYIFTPAGLEVKLSLSIFVAASGVLGFLGNLAVLRFIRREEKKRPRASRPSNLNYFISSLALSDILGAVICVPLLLINWSVDVFQTGWPCNIARFFIFLFPVITIYNLVVISLERYILICRATSRPLSRAVVQKLVKGAWILAIFIVLPICFTVKGIRVELDGKHYTVLCKVDNSIPYKAAITQSTVVVVYIVPFVFISFTTVSVIRTVWKRQVHVGNAGNETMRSKQKKATVLLLAIILAFVMPYFLIIAYTIYEFIAKLPTDFKRDFVIRSTGAFLTYLNGAVNFCIHLAQLPGFSLSPRSVQHSIKEPINRHKKETENCDEREIRRASVCEPTISNTGNQHIVHTRRHSA